MQSRSKLFVAGLIAGVLLAVAVGSASANNLSVSHGNLWRVVYRPISVKSGGVTAAACELILEGSFHSGTIRKIERLLVGYITRASVGACSTGTATVLRETLPWHLQYLGFTGILPDITGVRLILVGESFQIRDAIFGSVCLGRTSESSPAGGIAELEAGNERRLVTSVKSEETRRIRCGTLEASFGGTATVTEEPGGSSNLLVKLI